MVNVLQHHGIKGMRWGVRRYQNYDGRYTQAGLARYRESIADRDNAKAKYKTMKKEGGYTKHELKRQKAKVKLANKQADRRYNLLKTDKLADKGRVRYEEGERIRERNSHTKAINKAAGYSIIAGTIAFAKPTAVRNGIYAVSRMLTGGKTRIDVSEHALRTIGAVMTISGVSVATIAKGKRMVDERKNKEISAYYSHRYAR